MTMSLMRLFAALATTLLVVSAAGIDEKLKCAAQLDPDDNNAVIVILDLSDLSVVQKVTDATIKVDFFGTGGNLLGTEQYRFVDSISHEPPLDGGGKYFR